MSKKQLIQGVKQAHLLLKTEIKRMRYLLLLNLNLKTTQGVVQKRLLQLVLKLAVIYQKVLRLYLIYVLAVVV